MVGAGFAHLHPALDRPAEASGDGQGLARRHGLGQRQAGHAGQLRLHAGAHYGQQAAGVARRHGDEAGDGGDAERAQLVGRATTQENLSLDPKATYKCDGPAYKAGAWHLGDRTE